MPCWHLIFTHVTWMCLSRIHTSSIAEGWAHAEVSNSCSHCQMILSVIDFHRYLVQCRIFISQIESMYIINLHCPPILKRKTTIYRHLIFTNVTCIVFHWIHNILGLITCWILSNSYCHCKMILSIFCFRSFLANAVCSSHTESSYTT